MRNTLFILLLLFVVVNTIYSVSCAEEPRPEPVIAEKDLEEDTGPIMPGVVITKASADGAWESYIVNCLDSKFEIRNMNGEMIEKIEIMENTQLQFILINDGNSPAMFKLSIGDHSIEQYVPAGNNEGIIVEIPVFEQGQYTIENETGDITSTIEAVAVTG